MLGDVTKIIDINGNVVVEYKYDSWGKVLSTTGSKASTVGLDNPIRYRGYYYDTQTNLYYLNSRYYDAETGRFISADSVAENGNLYTYCQNDPVNRSDESGYLSKFWTRIIKIAIGAVASIAAVALTVATGGAALPIVASIAVSAGISAGLGAIGAAINGGDVFDAATDGLVDGFMWGGITAWGSAAIQSATRGNLLNGAKPSFQSPNIAEYKFSKTALKHTDRPYYNSVITQQNIVDIGLATYETPNIIKYVVPGFFNGEPGVFEIVIDITYKLIYHLLFRG